MGLTKVGKAGMLVLACGAVMSGPIGTSLTGEGPEPQKSLWCYLFHALSGLIGSTMTRPLARKNDGCYECCKRRLRCDKTEPQCLKCQRKGIQCTGQGFRCRFSRHMSARPMTSSASRSAPEIGKRRMYPTISRSSTSIPNFSQPLISQHEPLSQHIVTRTNLDAVPGEVVSCASSSTQSNAQTLSLHELRRNGPSSSLQSVPARLRRLISHFCEHIAPMMVVHDFAGNGYRDIILPLAVQNEVLGKAVSAVAAFHLAQKIPHLRQEALIEHHAVLARLQRDSVQLCPDEVFTPSTWATIVVLLVGETITGADNYRHLLAMLTCLQQMPGAFKTLTPSLQDFFMKQIKMFELFGFPLSDEAKGLEIIQQTPDHYMGFMSYPTFEAGSEHHANLKIMRCAIREACNLYLRRASSTVTEVDSTPQVERLRQCVLPLQTHTPGAHALVWTYFVAAAESALPHHRQFFVTRLTNLHQLTQFGSIPAALKVLDTIWALQGTKRWTDVVSKDFPVLIM